MADGRAMVMSSQPKFLRQQIQSRCRQLGGVLPDLTVEARMVVRVHATLERLGIHGSIEELGGQTQRAHAIASCPRSTDLIGLPIHFASSSMVPNGASSSGDH